MTDIELLRSKIDINKFTQYFNSFYGINGVYPYRDTTAEDITLAILLLKRDRPDYTFVGGFDSVDREVIRDYIFSAVDLGKIYK